jgi:hypothetical protein
MNHHQPNTDSPGRHVFAAIPASLRKPFLITATLMMVQGARASLYTENFTSGSAVGTISGNFPVGSYFVGSVNNANPADRVTGLTITMNVSFTSGDFGNGSLYAYLVSPNNTLVQLFGSLSGGEAYGIGGSPGNPFGNSGSGLNLTLSDSASGSIQNAPDGIITGTYQAMGSLANFDGSDVNGNWTLFFSETTSGGPIGTLNNWSLNIQTVPVAEPINAALSIFGALGVLSLFVQQRKSSRPTSES